MTQTFTDLDRFNLFSQTNTFAVSIPSNIAEGSCKSTDRYFKKFLETPLRSAFEWKTLIVIANKVRYKKLDVFNHYETKIKQNIIYDFKI